MADPLIGRCFSTGVNLIYAVDYNDESRIVMKNYCITFQLDVQEKGLDTNTEYGSWATDSRTQTNLVKTSKTLKLKQTQKQANVLSTAIFAEGEGLGLEADLCQDLAVLLSGPRVKTLYWDLDR
ncbi:jg25666 [Pararge aegeria aegeria]|uniref:Jg25666 protein n=1 Tax=Pararge aegeria aegeria TaxID=348720 RepID=A0A8S4QIN8_9NEOP|nr:jg25666 [Pararge aegeria aegeria]